MLESFDKWVFDFMGPINPLHVGLAHDTLLPPQILDMLVKSHIGEILYSRDGRASYLRM
jgi:hypothetical protein